MTGNTSERWGSVQIGLHWLIAALILIQVPAGWVMANAAPGALQDFLYNVHKNVGVIVFALAVVRLAWRRAHPVPLLPADMPDWQRTAAHVTHMLLYALLFLMPVTGFLYTTLSGYPVPLFMVWDLARLVPVNKPLGEWFEIAHLSLQWLLYLVVVLHVAGALNHHLVRKDWVLRRMTSSTVPLQG
ncbi:MAG: cytochrome b [Geminicoccaceae bacterium]